MIRRIRELLYDQGFTISGARNKLHEIAQFETEKRCNGEVMLDGMDISLETDTESSDFTESDSFRDNGFPVDFSDMHGGNAAAIQRLQFVRQELFEIRELLTTSY